VKIPPHSSIGYDAQHDRQRGFAITEQGVVVIAKAELPEPLRSKPAAGSRWGFNG
jgi:hypothetical protein